MQLGYPINGFNIVLQGKDTKRTGYKEYTHTNFFSITDFKTFFVCLKCIKSEKKKILFDYIIKPLLYLFICLLLILGLYYIGSLMRNSFIGIVIQSIVLMSLFLFFYFLYRLIRYIYIITSKNYKKFILYRISERYNIISPQKAYRLYNNEILKSNDPDKNIINLRGKNIELTDEMLLKK